MAEEETMLQQYKRLTVEAMQAGHQGVFSACHAISLWLLVGESYAANEAANALEVVECIKRIPGYEWDSVLAVYVKEREGVLRVFLQRVMTGG